MTGRVVGPDSRPVFVAAWLEIDGQRAPYVYGTGFVIATDHGPMTIELDERAIEPEHLSGRWGDLATTPLARLFAANAPGDHIHVKITGTIVTPGDFIAVSGEPLEHAVQAGAGYRDAPTAIVRTLRASCIGRGTDEGSARAAHDRFQRVVRDRTNHEARVSTPRPPARPPTIPLRWLARGFALAAIGAGIVAVSDADALHSGWFAVGLQLVGLALVAWSARHEMAHAVELGNEPRAAVLSTGLYYLQGPLTYLGLAGHGDGLPVIGGRYGYAMMVSVVPIIAIVIWTVRQWKTARWLHIVARAPLATRTTAAGAWTKIVGTLAGSGTDPIVVTTDRMSNSASSGNSTSYYTALRTSVTSSPAIEITAGAVGLDVITNHAIVAGVPHWTWVDSSDAQKWSWATPHAELTFAAGDEVTVLGRPRIEGARLRFEATGPESLFIVRGSPRKVLASLRAPIVAFAAFLAAVGIIYSV